MLVQQLETLSYIIQHNEMSEHKQQQLKLSHRKQFVLENPFHPLDLSANDLLTIYKRFDVSSKVNRNPQQQLPIQTIAQLISTLKGCKPSYIQKCMSQALIKQTLSWKDFLAFLDQESEVRHKILDWLLHEKATIKHKFHGQYPFRNKIQKYYDEITYLNFTRLGPDQLLFAVIDYKKIVLIDITEGKFVEIDSYIQKNQVVKRHVKQSELKNESKMVEIKSELKKSYYQRQKHKQTKNTLNKSMIRSERIISQSHTDVSNFLYNSANHQVDQDTYFKKQRKNIHLAFNLFNELPLEQSQNVAKIMTQRLKNQTVSSGSVSAMKDKYSSYEIQKKNDQRQVGKVQLKPLEKATNKLKSMYQQKNQLSYNPYQKLKSTKTNTHIQLWAPSSKKLAFERKERQYFMECSSLKFCRQLNCIGVIYYNMEVCLIKITRQFNKIVLHQLDKIKIFLQKDHKKNEVIQGIDFYRHRITNKWFLLVLFRVQYKNDNKSRNCSIIKGYQIKQVPGNRKGEYKFAAEKKEEFIINLGPNEIIDILAQPQFGIHVISHDGKYIICKEDYVIQEGDEICYWKLQREQKLKNVSDSLSCIDTSSHSNKALIGTIKGTLIIYDLFSHHYKLKKICIDGIIRIRINEDRGYLLTESQKIIVYDIIRNQEIQILNVRNQERLHEKVKNFQLDGSRIVCYGTNIRIFQQVIDEDMQHEKSKLQNMYTWRLTKLQKSKGKTTNGSYNPPSSRTSTTNAELVITSKTFIIVLTQIQQAIFFAANSLIVKFTIILDIPYDAKIMKISLSEDEKLLAILLFDQTIYIFNIYTQELFLHIKPTHFNKYTTVSFLDAKNQYFMSCGTQNGRICLFTYPLSSEKQPKLLQLHTKSITCTTLKKSILISAGQDQVIGIWQLPFNILKHEIDLKKAKISDFLVENIGNFADTFSYFRSFDGKIFQIDIDKGDFTQTQNDFSEYTTFSIDSCTGHLIAAKKKQIITIWDRDTSKKNWQQNKKQKFDSKNQIIGIGIIPSQKAIIFTGYQYTVWPYKSQKPLKVKHLVDSFSK